MKPLSLISFLALFLFTTLSTAHAATTIEKVTLKPGESKSFSLKSETKLKVGFTPMLSSEEVKKCKNNCIEISQIGGTTMASIYGATIGMKPKDGKIEGAIKNVETFPIEVELFHK